MFEHFMNGVTINKRSPRTVGKKCVQPEGNCVKKMIKINKCVRAASALSAGAHLFAFGNGHLVNIYIVYIPVSEGAS